MDVASRRGLACGLIDRPMMRVSLIGHAELIEMTHTGMKQALNILCRANLLDPQALCADKGTQRMGFIHHNLQLQMVPVLYLALQDHRFLWCTRMNQAQIMVHPHLNQLNLVLLGHSPQQMVMTYHGRHAKLCIMVFMGKGVVHIGVVPLIPLLINHPHLSLAGSTCFYILCSSLFLFSIF